MHLEHLTTVSNEHSKQPDGHFKHLLTLLSLYVLLGHKFMQMLISYVIS